MGEATNNFSLIKPERHWGTRLLPTVDRMLTVQRIVIYVEMEYNQVVNEYIQSNISSIRKQFKEHKYKFIYIPEHFKIYDKTMLEVVKYNYPYLKPEEMESVVNSMGNMTTVEYTTDLYKYIGNTEKLESGLILPLKSTLLYYKLDGTNKSEVQDSFERYLMEYKEQTDRF